MKKCIRRLIGTALACGMTMSLIAGSAVTTAADSTKVVSLGHDLSDSQKNAVLKYFGVKSNQVQIVDVTNQDERNHLSSYVPIEQIGNHTISCAYVQPTTSGGIQVKTANLTYVTSNMIAAALSTSGVKNCNVIAAAPFAVSGTGALTGCIMAYEAATGEQLNTAKKDTAAKEMVTTGQIAQNIGQNQATEIVNKIKIDVIQNNVDTMDDDEINRIVDAAVEKALNERTEAEVSEEDFLPTEDMDELYDLAHTFAAQDYDYDDMEETLQRVEDNVGFTDATTDYGSEAIPYEETEEEPEELDEDNILMNTDDFALGDDVIIDATDEAALEDIPAINYADDGEEDDLFEITTSDEGNYDDALTDDSEETDFFGDLTDEDFAAFDDSEEEDFEAFDDSAEEDFEAFDDSEEESFEDDSDVSDEAEDFDLIMNGIDSYALRIFVDGNVTPVSGMVTISDESGNPVETVDFTSCEAVSMTSEELSNAGFMEGTTIYVPVDYELYEDARYSVSVSGTLSNDDTGVESPVSVSGNEVTYHLALIAPEYSGIFSSDSFADMMLFFPEGASYAVISSSNEAVLTALNSEVYAEDGSDAAYLSLTTGNAGTAELTAEFYSEDGEYIDESSVKVGVSASGSFRAE